MEAFYLSQQIEHALAHFGYPIPVSRDLIVANPTEAIEDAFRWLAVMGAISNEEFSEHIHNYEWGDMSLEDIINDADRREQVYVLLRNLEGWSKRYRNRIKDQMEEE